jgi:hypothetical protein
VFGYKPSVDVGLASGDSASLQNFGFQLNIDAADRQEKLYSFF